MTHPGEPPDPPHSTSGPTLPYAPHGRPGALFQVGAGLGFAGFSIGLLIFVAACFGFGAALNLAPLPLGMGLAGFVLTIIGGVRDPQNSRRDTYSPLEADAIEWAVRHGVVVVAAVGNGDQAPSMPWPYASYPAALPHVIGVSALARDGSVPAFSNRDRVYNDLSAPGEDIVSTLPRQLTSQKSACPLQGYSDCGPLEFKKAEGTSFAAPQVSAAAALLLNTAQALGVDLEPSQVAELLTRSAHDVTPAMVEENLAWIRARIRYETLTAAYGTDKAQQAMADFDLQLQRAITEMPAAGELSARSWRRNTANTRSGQK